MAKRNEAAEKPKRKRIRKKVLPVNDTNEQERKETVQQKEILTANETMSLLDISRNTFDRFHKDGTLKVYRLGARRLYCKYSEIMKTISESQVLSS